MSWQNKVNETIKNKSRQDIYVCGTIINPQLNSIFSSVKDQLRFADPMNIIREVNDNMISISGELVDIHNFKKKLLSKFNMGIPYTECKGFIISII